MSPKRYGIGVVNSGITTTPIKYLTLEDLITIYTQTVPNTPIPDPGKLTIIVDLPQRKFVGQPIYKTIYEQAAVMMYEIVKLHLFTDGNKRMAFITTDIFLRINDIIMENNEHIVTHLLKIAKSEMSRKRCLSLIKGYLQRISMSRNQYENYSDTFGIPKDNINFFKDIFV